MGSSIDLDGLAHDVLDACVAILNTIPTDDPTLSGAPDRSYVSPGVPVWDCCEQLTVYVPVLGEQFTRPTSPAGASSKKHLFGRIPLTTLVVQISRCVPEGGITGTTYQPPSVAALEAAAAQIHADGRALDNGLFNYVAAGILTDRCSEVAWDGVVASTPSGGCAGWAVTMRFQQDGYGYGDPIST